MRNSSCLFPPICNNRLTFLDFLFPCAVGSIFSRQSRPFCRNSHHERHHKRQIDGHDQEIRKSSPVQYGDKLLRHAGRPFRDGERGRGVQCLRRQNQRRHHALCFDANHRGRRRKVGPAKSFAHRLFAPTDLVLRRQHAMDGSKISRPQHANARPEPRANQKLFPIDFWRHVPLWLDVRGNGQAKHGHV